MVHGIFSKLVFFKEEKLSIYRMLLSNSIKESVCMINDGYSFDTMGKKNVVSKKSF